MHSSGCAHGGCVWANAKGSGDRTTWLAACRSLVCGTFSNAVSAGRHLPTPMPMPMPTPMPTPMHSRGRTVAASHADVAPNARVRPGSFVRNGPVWGQEKGVCLWTPCPESPSLHPGAPPRHSPPRASDLCPTRSPRGQGRCHSSGWRGDGLWLDGRALRPGTAVPSPRVSAGTREMANAGQAWRDPWQSEAAHREPSLPHVPIRLPGGVTATSSSLRPGRAAWAPFTPTARLLRNGPCGTEARASITPLARPFPGARGSPTLSDRVWGRALSQNASVEGGNEEKNTNTGTRGSASRTGTRDEASAATRAHAPCTPRPAPPARGRGDRDVTQRAPARAVGSGRTLTTPSLQARAHAPAPRRTQPVTAAKLRAASSSSTSQKVSPSAVRRRKCAWPGGL